jgi:hypothetical protein
MPASLPLFVPIPPIFQSLEKDGPFEKCINCERSLLEDGVTYLIERAFKGDEPIIELAMCLECHDLLADELSEESRQRMTEFMKERVDQKKRNKKLAKLSNVDQVETWLSECVLTGASASDCQERQIYGLCLGDQMILDQLPFMISGAGIEEMTLLLSEKTKGWMRDFTDKNFGMPPEFSDAPDYSPLLV